MRILVTGSRKWTNEAPIMRALSDASTIYRPQPGEARTLVHGDARGLDRLAARIVQTWPGNWQVEAHPADWDREGKAAGPLRNQRMVDAGADVCLAFPDADSVGTWDCIRRANRAGILTLIYPERRRG